MKKKVLAMLLAIVLVVGIMVPVAAVGAEGDNPYLTLNHPYWSQDNPNGYWAENREYFLSAEDENGQHTPFPTWFVKYDPLMFGPPDNFTPEAVLSVYLASGGGRGLQGWFYFVQEGYEIVADEVEFGVGEQTKGLKDSEYVIIGDCYEFGDARLIYADGTVVNGIRQVFTDGERITMPRNPDRAGESYAVVVKYKVVRGTLDSKILSGAGGWIASTGIARVEFATNSPYAATRIGGVGSVQDILYTTDEGEQRIRPNPNLPGNSTGTDTNQPNAAGPVVTPKYLDVSDTHWGRANIISAYNKGLMTGVEVRPNGDIRFDPEGTLTRAQVAQILYNAYGGRMTITAAERDIVDVREGAWYYEAIDWAIKYRFIDVEYVEGRKYFYPDSLAPRWFIAEALYRLAREKKNPFSTNYNEVFPKNTAPMTFRDLANAKYSAYLPAISALQQAGIIGGFPDGTFRPDDALTRAQAAKLIDMFTDIEGLASDAMRSNK